MRLTLLTLWLAIVCHSASAVDTAKSIDHLATHQQSGVIEIDDDDNPLNINAFCLDPQGRIVAACGEGPGEVRIVNDEGTILRAWKVDVKPEAINVADDGTILVGGEGNLFRFDDQGRQVLMVESPHAVRLRTDNEQLRKAAIAALTARANPIQSRIANYETILQQLEERAAKGKLNATEERMMEMLPGLLERYRAQFAELDNEKSADAGPSEEAIQAQVASMVRTKMRISSISSSGGHVFIATRGLEGYGYDVWKMNSQFEDANVIVTGLRGCCGQMDVQCCAEGLFVAENSRDRVVHYDTDGNEITHWGKSDRTGIDGFTSCCNPMNVCFDANGDIYTAESSSGRIKRFTSQGELVSFIGDVDLVPGCKNVSIAVSKVNGNIYMLDLTRNHIKLMQPKSEGAALPLNEQVDSVSNQSQENASHPIKSAANFVLSLIGAGGDSNE